jgi:hypothetical protein
MLASAYGFTSVALWRADVAAQSARVESQMAEMAALLNNTL